MRSLFITTHGIRILKSGSELRIVGKNVDKRVPVGTFDNLFLFSNATLSVPLMKFLSKKGKFIFIVDACGKLKSMVVPEILGSPEKVRRKQYEKFFDKNKQVSLCKELLRRKAYVANYVLRSFERMRGLNRKFSFYENFYRDALNYIEGFWTVEQLRGADGFIMKTLYGELANSVSEFFYFRKRTYNPPGDEVNAVLSLSFTIFYSLLIPYIISFNLDPYCGFFHIKRGNHAVLASDLLEIVRPHLIFFTADLLNSGVLVPSDFKKIGKGTYLKSKGLKVFCKLFMERVTVRDFLYAAGNFIKEEILS